MKFVVMKVFLLFFCALLSLVSFSQQSVSGVVLDENNSPIPFAEVLVKNTSDLRTTCDVNGAYSLQLNPAEYFFVFRAEGYQDRESYVAMKEQDITLNIQLFPVAVNEIEEVTINAKHINYGRLIMLEVVKRRDKMNLWNYPHSVDVYIKAVENIERGESKNKNNSQAEIDPFEVEQQKVKNLAGSMNLAEVQIKRDYAPPGKVKETRDAFTIYGSDDQLYYTTTVKANFNFFENLLTLPDLHETPIQSPISGPGIVSYKYRLEKQYQENGRKIHKIKISARMSSTSTLDGYIYIIDSIYLVQKLELTLSKGNLKKYDYFTVYQEFENVGDTLCVLMDQRFTYGTKFKGSTSKCVTRALFSNYSFKTDFAKKYFNSELAVTTQEAYERDSSFWRTERKISLSPEEQRYIIVRDSIHDALNRKEYLDSVDGVFNKVTFLKVAWFGIEHRNRAKMNQWWFSSIASTIRPLFPGGPRIEPMVNYFKKFKNQKYYDFQTGISYGPLNKDIKGNIGFDYLYNPFKIGFFGADFQHTYDAIVPFDAITQVYKRSNFIEKTSIILKHRYEWFNGFYTNLRTEFTERRSLSEFKKFESEWVNSWLPNDEFTDFIGYQAWITELTVSYVPKQKYMREPFRKVVLGSKWPTFYATYERGIPKIFGSDTDHEYGVLGVMQSFQLRTIGTTAYHIRAAQFLSARNLQAADFKFQRRSTPLWFTNPLYGYQNQDSSLPSQDYFLEFHFVHHDNSAIINKIPFMKKTRIGLVVGTSALYVSEYNYQYYEIFAGLERSFKLSRRRLRIGLYGVASDGNKIDPRLTYKISFAMLDDRNMKWNF